MTKWRGIIEKKSKSFFLKFSKEENGGHDNFSYYVFVFLMLSDGFLS